MSRPYELKPFRPKVELQIDYAGELNEQQHAAATAQPGPALVIAGAGSGKTRTLTYRVAYLIETGTPPESILLLTFTNKAAQEMMGRVRSLLGSDLANLWGGTFHSIGHRMLRRYADLIDYRKDFTILDRQDSKDLLKTCIGALDFDPKETRFPKPDVLQNVFSMSANMGTPIEELLGTRYPHFSQLVAPIEALGKAYTKRKHAANVMDFDDLLTLWHRLLKDNDDVRERLQYRFRFILVDEYQDTNELQAELIDMLGAKHKHVMVVGDDSQSIYSWRGADFRNILNFPEKYPGAATYKIEVNYRSTPEILAVANAAIKANIHQFEKQLEPARPSGNRPAVVACNDGNEQAAFVAQRALELREEGIELTDMAVLYRSHFHALELQLELTRRNIPFAISSGIRFFEQAHVKDVAAHLKLICNPLDEVSFKRAAMLMRGIGTKGADKLWTIFHDERTRLMAGAAESEDGDPDWDVEEGDSAEPVTAAPKEPIAAALRITGVKAPKKASNAWTQFADTMGQLEDPGMRGRPSDMIQLLMDASYEEYLKENFENYRSRLDDLVQLASFALQFDDIEEFLGQLALLTNVEAEAQQSEPDDEKIKLSTIHQAKGLEFDVVFVIMLCDGLFPSARSLEDLDGEEEERRLFYVAVTRARNELYLTYPLIRAAQGYGDYMQTASRFLSEIPRELVEDWSLQTSTPYSDSDEMF
jgi:DNA helicase-2/ATP-dependent DNA helicase PcrA